MDQRRRRPLSHVFRLPLIPPFSGGGSPSWSSNCYIVGKRGSRVSFNRSGRSATTAILWDHVPAFLGMSIGSAYTSGRYPFALATDALALGLILRYLIPILLDYGDFDQALINLLDHVTAEGIQLDVTVVSTTLQSKHCSCSLAVKMVCYTWVPTSWSPDQSLWARRLSTNSDTRQK
ncbi:hypothetical protein WN943_005906 [Citrus x changshan-huyou]